MPKRIDGVEIRCPPRRPDTRHQPRRHGACERDEHGFARDYRDPIETVGEHCGYRDATGQSRDAAKDRGRDGCGQSHGQVLRIVWGMRAAGAPGYVT